MRMAKKCIRVLQTWFEFSSVCLVYFKSLGYDGIMVVGSRELGFFLQLHIEKKNQKKKPVHAFLTKKRTKSIP